MQKKAGLLLLAFLFGFLLLNSNAFSQAGFSKGEEGRYILLMAQADSSKMEVPAIVLDSVQGVVWVCENIGKNDPVWVETDLGQNGDKKLLQRKYIAKMSEVGGFNSKIAATVLDIEKGIVWTCANIGDEESAWIQKDLKSNTEKEITKKNEPRINIKFDNTEDFLH